MKTIISQSAQRLTAALLEKTKYGSYHGGAQQVSSVGGRDILWNYVDQNGSVVTTRAEATAVVCNRKLYKF